MRRENLKVEEDERRKNVQNAVCEMQKREEECKKQAALSRATLKISS